MKKLFIAIAAALMISSATYAQDENYNNAQHGRFDKKEMIQRRTEHMVQEFGLDNNQAKKLLELNTAYADKLVGPHMMSPFGRPGFGRGPQGGNNKFGPDSTKARMNRPELTEEQKARMNKWREEVEANNKSYETALQGILTADQFKAYQDSKIKMHGNFKQHSVE
ncbi:hypothetical protein XylorDRAFT_0172 [Xylanibacter oryzae DSM 17970]|uniref:LTXXQ motif family protein n=1 Tax=Xylanibacter oryzae DSM 17970 TaxID=915438 RepID=A0ABN0RUA8_9BACT|nr:DUF4890 domain-containing protein [Xylanibacter oryzae]EXG77825.1 hypothetical protein XylorDRAFT_0172 [Xylanibacter oryzae DSM 17970]